MSASEARGALHRLSGDDFAVEIDELGSRIASIVHRPSGHELLLRTRWSREPAESPAESELNWSRRFANGWNVLIPHAGEARHVDGVDHPYHGEAARRVWDVSVSGQECTASLLLESLPLRLLRTVRLDENGVRVSQTVTNVGSVPYRFGWVEHPVFDNSIRDGASFTFGNSAVHSAPAGRMSFHDVDAPNGSCGFDTVAGRIHLRWDSEIFPNAYVWQERGGTTGFPWFGEVDGVGIEPASHPSGHPSDGLGPLLLQPGASMGAWVQLNIDRTRPDSEERRT